MFAYYFPPLGGGGVQRTLKFVKYLPAEGFQSIVVAGGRRGFTLRDTTLMRDVPPGTVVVRARAVPLQQAQWKLDGLLRRAGLPTSWLKELLWPDSLVGWLPAAVVQGLRAARAYRPDVIFSTSKPETAHLAALIVHRLTGIPWVADFRDSWTLNPTDLAPPAERMSTRASGALEQSVVERASSVTVACESVALQALAAQDSRRIHISNGVDPDDIPPSVSAPIRDGRFRLAHVGTLYGSRDASAVLEVIQGLTSEGRIDPAAIELRVIGHASLNGAELRSAPITFTGYVTHEQALAEMAAATALLFYQPRDEMGSSGKIYEYLVSGRPVLCVASPDNVSYRLVQSLGAGTCVDVGDPEAIAQAIEQMAQRWFSGEDISPDSTVRSRTLARFSRRRLAADLAQVLNAAIAGERSEPCGATPAPRRAFDIRPTRSSSSATSSVC
jgi:glycosyltransferase involved in cell wall biosynthesis